MLTNVVPASEIGGEVVFDHAPLVTEAGADLNLPVDIGPLKYLLGSLSSFIKGIAKAANNKKQLVIVILMVLTWIALTVLPIFKINPPAFKILNFLTFAQGGLNNGIPGIIGGTIGRGIWAYFVFLLIMPVLSGKMPFSGMGQGLKTLFASLAGNNKRMVALLLFGTSLALISYNFMAGQASLQNSMVGIAAFFVSVRALNNKAGFLRGFVSSLLRKGSGGVLPDINMINRFMAGWAWGFALAVLLSSVNFSIIAYLFGLLLLLAALILYKKSGSSQEVAA
ncbi:MAG: hypothetical protein ACM3QW_00805 [Ignavibacteriales bacterium]